ncbi:hypothetical protein B0H13DRAFT_2301808 [Mycena leptocephala]|nr:hypothetical protein B0H13DRAFT_2301808 [Mycena leptocephala]
MRKEARKDDNHTHSKVEVFYNDMRRACLPKTHLLLLEKQDQHEEDLNLPHTQLPGTALVTNYLRTQSLPEDISELYNPNHPHWHWEHFIAILYTILSNHFHDWAIKQLLLSDTTLVHFQVIPYSPDYSLHKDDPWVRFNAAIRILIVMILTSLTELLESAHRDSRILHRYLVQVSVRDRWQQKCRFDPTFLARSTLSLIYLQDVNPSSDHHPFMYQFEIDFLRAAVEELVAWRASPGYHELSEVVKYLTNMNDSPHQDALSKLFLSGIFEQVTGVEIFKPDYDWNSHGGVDTPDGFRSGDDDD